MNSLPVSNVTALCSIVASRRMDHADEHYVALPAIAKVNLEAKQVTSASNSEDWAYMDLWGYDLRVSMKELRTFQSAFGGLAAEEDWTDFLIGCAETRYHGEWIPVMEGLRLDNESVQEFEEASHR